MAENFPHYNPQAEHKGALGSLEIGTILKWAQFQDFFKRGF